MMQIVIHPNQILKTRCEFNPNIDMRLIADMKKTVIRRNALGLAAPQVGVLNRFFVMKDGFYLTAIINPVIHSHKSENVISKEGCLSIPGFTTGVLRWKTIDVEYADENGKKVERTLSGLVSYIFQHEFDHLDGKLINDGK